MNRIVAVRLLVGCVILTVLGAVVAAMVVLGSPAEQRQRRLDERRVQDLSTIATTVTMYVSTHHALPVDMATLETEVGFGHQPVDPGSGSAYEYVPLGPETYQLCAVFAMPSSDANARPTFGQQGWSHDAGRQCFTRSRNATN